MLIKKEKIYFKNLCTFDVCCLDLFVLDRRHDQHYRCNSNKLYAPWRMIFFFNNSLLIINAITKIFAKKYNVEFIS